MGTCKNKNAKIANLQHPQKFKPEKIRACTVLVVPKCPRARSVNMLCPGSYKNCISYLLSCACGSLDRQNLNPLGIVYHPGGTW